jgi:predicted HTH domain antitoxin
MSTETLTVVLSESLARELNSASQDFLTDLLERGLREVRIERALQRYVQGGMSFGAAAHEAGLSQSELARQAYARGMEPPFSKESLAEDLG